eukprot:c27217_g1_i1 orf=715-2652(-)
MGTISLQDSSRPRKAPQTVTKEGRCCCGFSHFPGWSSCKLRLYCPTSKELQKKADNIQPKSAANKHNNATDNKRSSSHNQKNHKTDAARKSRELDKAGGLVKTREFGTSFQQRFVSGRSLGKSGSGSPVTSSPSPSRGRVSSVSEFGVSASIPPSVPDFNTGNFNLLLNTGLPNPASPPLEKLRGSPTLFELVANEQETQPRSIVLKPLYFQSNSVSCKQPPIQVSALSANSPNNQFNDESSSDVKLILSNRDGMSVTLHLHQHILMLHSRLFAGKLFERCPKQSSTPHLVEISDCDDDIEIYIDTLRLMYSLDLKRQLMKESVARVLRILKVSAAIDFEAGVVSCLEYLEAVPWAEEEEEKVTSMLSQLQLHSIEVGEVLERVSPAEPSGSEDTLACLFHLVTKASDEKARREMKNLISRLLRENAAQMSRGIDISKESLYHSCHGCLDLLLLFFMKASNSDFISKATEDRGLLLAQISQQVDNLHWLVEILIDRHLADDFVEMWAYQNDLAALHSQIPALFRHEVSRLTARLCVALGKGQVLATRQVRFMLLQTWLQPLIDDFAWIQRACKGLDWKVIEEGISQTILTLPLKQQQVIILAWLDRFLNSGDNCPNLQQAFQVWWRRIFVRHCLESTAISQSVLS